MTLTITQNVISPTITIDYSGTSVILNPVINGGSGSGNSFGSFSKIPITITSNGQTSFNIASLPDNIDVVIGRVPQSEGTDYTYSNQTGGFEIINTSVGNSITTNSLIDLYGYSNSLSKPERLIISNVGQSVFNISEKPKSIRVIFNRTNLSEGTDFTYSLTTGDLTLINTFFTNQVTLNTIIDTRKFY